MRTILYRGKNVDNDEWIYGAYVCNYSNNTHYIVKFNPTSEMKNYRVNPKTVGEFTGVYDKNNEMIFEHDIIKYYNTLYEVFYNDGLGMFCLRDKEVLFYDFDAFNYSELEVVDNIFNDTTGKFIPKV